MVCRSLYPVNAFNTFEVNMDPKTLKPLKANSISEEPKKRDFTTIDLKTLKTIKEAFPKSTTPGPDMSYILSAVGVIQMLLSVIGLFLFFYDIPAYVFIPHFGQWALGDDTFVPQSFFIGYLLGLALLFISSEKPPKAILALWIWFAMFLTAVTTIEFIRDFEPTEWPEGLELNLYHLISFLYHTIIILLAREFYINYKPAEKYRNSDVEEDLC